MKRKSVILVTGGCGYLGSQLIRDLGQVENEGITIRILDNMQSGNYQALMGLPGEGNYEFVEGDILDPAALRLALQEVETVVHLAAVVRTPMGFGDTTWIKQVNQWGTARLVEACLDAGVKHLVYASSAAVYGPGGPFDETASCYPVGPYAQSVYQAEKSIQAAATRGVKSTILRLGTLFGFAPIMRFDSIANRFAYLSGINRPVTVFGKGEQRRPMLHVKDASAAVMFSLHHIESPGLKIFNVAEENASVLDVLAAIKHSRPFTQVHYTEQDVLTHFSFEIKNHALIEMGWQPKFTLEAGLSELLAHFGHIQTVRLNMNDIP